jgi:hypothetical protein
LPGTSVTSCGEPTPCSQSGEVADQEIDLLGAVNLVAGMPPVQPAEQPLARQIGQAWRRQRREMRIGQVGEDIHGE